MISTKSLKYYSESLLSYVSMASYRSKKIYVFGSWQGQKFSDNSKYLFLQAIKDKDLTAIWITKNRTIYEYMRKKGYPVFMHNSLQGVYYQLRAGAYFTSERKQDISAMLMGNATRINLWHGVGLKKILSNDFITQSRQSKKKTGQIGKVLKRMRQSAYRKEYVLSTSDTMSEIFASAFNKPIDKILQLGQPRNDVFYADELETEVVPFADGKKKIVLYMPTHRNFGETNIPIDRIFDLQELNEFCQSHNLLFVVKKHFRQRFDKDDIPQYSNIIDITESEQDSQLLLKKADILVTDYSSCYVDYLLLDRPVIFYNYDYEKYLATDRDLYFDYETTTPGPKAQDFVSLLICLSDALKTKDDKFKSERERVKNIFYSKDNQQVVGKKILAYVKEHIL